MEDTQTTYAVTHGHALEAIEPAPASPWSALWSDPDVRRPLRSAHPQRLAHFIALGLNHVKGFPDRHHFSCGSWSSESNPGPRPGVDAPSQDEGKCR